MGLMLDSAEVNQGELGANYMVYYNQEAAYKESELNKLRLAKSDLEYKIKQLVDEHSVDIERMQAQIGLLKDEIERCKLNDARVDLNRENLEYIKNVVFNYMTTRDQNVRASMISAIIQILKFSKSEKMKLNQLMGNTASSSYKINLSTKKGLVYYFLRLPDKYHLYKIVIIVIL